eukprot:15246640-Ditylum_brightwellii.AAC.2
MIPIAVSLASQVFEADDTSFASASVHHMPGAQPFQTLANPLLNTQIEAPRTAPNLLPQHSRLGCPEQ